MGTIRKKRFMRATPRCIQSLDGRRGGHDASKPKNVSREGILRPPRPRAEVENVVPLPMRNSQQKPVVPLEVIEKLPKTDLHVHLDGSLRLATIIELAEKDRIELPSKDPEGLRKAMHLGENCGSLV